MKKNNNLIVLWDFGGVLTKSPFLNIKKYEKEISIPEKSIIKINSTNPLNNAWAKLEKNLISYNTFSENYISEAASIGIKKIKPLELLKCLEAPLDKEMTNILSMVSDKYICACLTNNVKNFYSEKSKQAFDSIKKNFKFVFESSKIGLRKPERGIYLYVIKKMNVNPNNIIFIDDLGINLKPAKEIGIITYKHTSPKDTLNFLKNKLLV